MTYVCEGLPEAEEVSHFFFAGAVADVLDLAYRYVSNDTLE